MGLKLRNYGAVTQKTFKIWYHRFESGDFDLLECKRSGYPKKDQDVEFPYSLSPENKERRYGTAYLSSLDLRNKSLNKILTGKKCVFMGS